MTPILGIWASGQQAPSGSYESIATTTVGAGGSATITFSSIPSTYKHLQIRYMARSSVTNNTTSIVNTTFNSDTGNNYSRHELYGTGTSAASAAATSTASADGGLVGNATTLSNTFGVGIIDILDYTNTNKYKTTRTLSGFNQNNNGEEEIWFASSLWLNTSAITSIRLESNSLGGYAQYSSFALYGIRG